MSHNEFWRKRVGPVMIMRDFINSGLKSVENERWVHMYEWSDFLFYIVKTTQGFTQSRKEGEGRSVNILFALFAFSFPNSA